jgi:hypothetical protein
VYDYASSPPPAEIVLQVGGMVLRVPVGHDLVVNDIRMDCPCEVIPGDRVKIRRGAVTTPGLGTVDLDSDLEF